jgi:hypothetical protein
MGVVGVGVSAALGVAGAGAFLPLLRLARGSFVVLVLGAGLFPGVGVGG